MFVECGSQSGRFNINISETTFAMIKVLHFFMLIIDSEDTIFEGAEGRGIALVLNEVVDASIENCSFHSNVHASTFELAQYQQCYFFCR